MLALEAAQDFQPLIQATALVYDEELAVMNDETRAHYHTVIQDLLTLFTPICQQDLADEALFRRHIRALLHWHCPSTNIDAFDAFLASFSNLNRDYAKIMLWPVITGYRAQVPSFLKLLTKLNQRGMLSYFRKIYFEYAQTITALSDLLQTLDVNGNFYTEGNSNASDSTQYPTQHLFLDIAQRMPTGSNPKTNPPFETFALHFLLYASKFNVDIQLVDLKTLQKFWQRIHAKLFKYYNEDEARTEQTMQIFVRQISCPENGLILAPVCLEKTFFNGLEVLIENAIRHETVLEQFNQWAGVSLLRADAVAAALQDNYTVVTTEMALDITQIAIFNINVASYAIPMTCSSYLN